MSKERKKVVRARFREQVFERDSHKCKVCGCPDDLDAHHITDRHLFSDGGYVLDNGISLCPECHEKAEVFHRTKYYHCEEGFHPNDLYDMIGSSLRVILSWVYKDGRKGARRSPTLVFVEDGCYWS